MANFEDWVIQLRREFHASPELAFQEKKTSRKIAGILTDLKLEVTTGCGETGVTGLLRGKRPGKTIGLRADMDALPIGEKNDVGYSSQTDGVMHACGHDAHVALMLGVARYVAENELHKDFRGNVKFIFQPAEETLGGAKAMIRDGVLENPRVDLMLAAHVSNDVAAGECGIYENISNASSDSFSTRIRGRGGHGAHPHKTSDAILASCFFVTQLQSIVSRNVDPTRPAVVSVGIIRGGTAPNILPEEVVIEGTVRAMEEEVRQLVRKRLANFARALKDSYALEEVDFDFSDGCPPCANDPQAISVLRSAAEKALGPDKVRVLTPGMGAEDFACFAAERPSALMRLGTGYPGKTTAGPAHSPFFDIDEQSLMTGVRVFVTALQQYLAE